jgi:hypothetical protein
MAKYRIHCNGGCILVLHTHRQEAQGWVAQSFARPVEAGSQGRPLLGCHKMGALHALLQAQ